MLESKRASIERATRSADNKFARAVEREAEFRRLVQKERDEAAAKTQRLRALRLAKEAADKQAAEAQAKLAPEKSQKPKRASKAG